MIANAVLNPERVNQIFLECLFAGDEDTSKMIQAEGITNTTGFHPGRLQSHKVEIETLLGELPEQFKESVDGGWSFLNACNDKHGNQWTGLHQRMEQLFQLGIGIGRVKPLLPKEMWNVLPGGMPYYVIIE